MFLAKKCLTTNVSVRLYGHWTHFVTNLCGTVSQRWGLKWWKVQQNRMCCLTNVFQWKAHPPQKRSIQGRVNADMDYVGLYIALLNRNSSIRPSYLKDRTVWAMLPIRLLWFNLELHSHSCSSITGWWRGGCLQPRLSTTTIEKCPPCYSRL